MKKSFKNWDSFLLLFLSFAVPMFYLFVGSDSFASLTRDSVPLITKAVMIFIFLLGTFFAIVLRNKLLSFCFVLIAVVGNFLFLPESLFLISPMLAIFWGDECLERGNEKLPLFLTLFIPLSALVIGGYTVWIKHDFEFKDYYTQEKLIILLLLLSVFAFFAGMSLHLALKTHHRQAKVIKTKKESIKDFRIGVQTVFIGALVFDALLSAVYFVKYGFANDISAFSLGLWLLLIGYVLFKRIVAKKCFLNSISN